MSVCKVKFIGLGIIVGLASQLPWAPSLAYAFLDSRGPPQTRVVLQAARKAPGLSAVNTANPSKLTLAWDGRLQELRQFKDEHGHCNVPTRSGQLGKWVTRQRAEYAKMEAGEKSSMTEERRAALESLGFEWRLSNRRKMVRWEDRLEELRRYKEENGHCNVSTGSGQLATWVSTQRTQYRKLEAGKESSMTKARMTALEALGFEWRLQQSIWEDRLEELRQFKDVHGHCNVPARSGQLGRWVANQRREYRKMVAEEKTSMTEERRAWLDYLGFVWSMHSNSKI